MLVAWLLFLGGLILLFVGGEALVRGSSTLALRLGLTPLIVGLTVVAFGTSAPELVVSAKASLDGQSGIALGNVVGSNILNIGLILGLTALIHPLRVQVQILRIDVPIMIGVTVVTGALLAFAGLGRAGGTILLVALMVYLAVTVLLSRKFRPPAQVEAEFGESMPAPGGSAWLDLLLVCGGVGLLVLGSYWLVGGAVVIARVMGVTEAVIGLTIVSVGTSAPELATCVVAALRKEPDIALGNVLGSNIFNLLGILGVATVLSPVGPGELRLLDILAVVGFSVALFPMLWTGRIMARWEGVLLLVGYGAFLATLWPR